MRLNRRCIRCLIASTFALSGCVTAQNYVDEVPRHAGAPIAGALTPEPHGDTIVVATFNIAFALRVDSAARVLESDPVLRRADVILLQEMDARGTQALADWMGMHYVYYPATLHFRHRRDFGNAILSRWPIVEDARITLPHEAFVVRTLRTATAATIRAPRGLLRVYSTHLGTVVNITKAQRRAQLEAILDDARTHDRVIIGGDMNHPDAGEVAVDRGFAWPTRDGPPTASIARLDHILVKGMRVPDRAAAGTVMNNRAASDHLPVWTRVIF